MASIRFRDGKWRIQVLAGIDLGGRKRFRQTSLAAPNTPKGRAEARRIGAAMEIDADANQLAMGRERPNASVKVPTLAELMQLRLDLLGPSWSPTTRFHAPNRIATIKRSGLAETPVNEITSYDLEQLWAWALTKGALAGGPLSRSTVARLASEVRASLRRAVKAKIIPECLIDSETMPQFQRVHTQLPRAQVLAKVARALEGDPVLSLILRLEAMTGLRRGELLGLQWGDFDPVAMTVRIVRSVVVGDEGLTIKPTKTDRQRALSLDPQTFVMVESLRGSREDDFAQAADAFIFSSEPQGRTPWWPRYLNRRWDTIRDIDPDLARVTMRSVRHYVATYALSTEGVMAAQALAGHARASTTTDIYGHVPNAAGRSVATGLAAGLDS
jgi:integrase